MKSIYDAYYDGQFLPYDEVRIPLSDRSVFFGDGVYDAALGAGGRFYLLDAHINRFLSNLSRLGISAPYTSSQIERIFSRLQKPFGNETVFLYFQASRHGAERAHATPDGGQPHFLATVRPIPYPSPEKQLTVITAEDLRYRMCDVKTVNLLPNALTAMEAQKRGAEEAIFIRDGIVTECTHSNISILKDKTLFTHPKDRSILPGIMREALIRTAARLEIDVEEVPFAPDALFDADAVLITSTTKLCLAVGSINGARLNEPSALALQLIRLIHADFADFLRGSSLFPQKSM